jgi:hypothetical protein
LTAKVRATCANARQPRAELAGAGDPAAEADVTIRASGHQSSAWLARQAVHKDIWPKRLWIKVLSVAAQEHVDPWMSEHRMEPHTLPVRRHGGIGQAVSGTRAIH